MDIYGYKNRLHEKLIDALVAKETYHAVSDSGLDRTAIEAYHQSVKLRSLVNAQAHGIMSIVTPVVDEHIHNLLDDLMRESLGDIDE